MYSSGLVPKIVLLAFLYGSTTPLVAGAPFSAICFIVGSIGLSGQWQIGRFIAYSAIVHLGYFIMATTALLFYGFVYSLALLNLFLVISSISGYKDKIILLTITEGAGLTGIDGGLASR
jgi:NADH:ubiquinone oxidoreductase subunit 2 (subunit N)